MAHQPYPGPWQGGPQPPYPPPPPPRNRTGLIVGLATALAVAVVALVVVLVTKGDDGGSGGSADPGTGGTGGAPSAARPGTVPNTQPARSTKPYEQLALDFVSEVQNNDLDGARRLTCASFRSKIRIAPLDLHSPTGMVVNKIDTFLLGGSSALTDTDTNAVSKANVGVRLQDGDQWVQWILAVRPEGGEQRICGNRVMDRLDIVPSVS